MNDNERKIQNDDGTQVETNSVNESEKQVSIRKVRKEIPVEQEKEQTAEKVERVEKQNPLQKQE